MVKQWEEFKDEIRTLYLDQRMPLGGVQAHMENKYGFSASIRSYRGNLHDWGFKRSDNKSHTRSSHRRSRNSTMVNTDRPLSPASLTASSIDTSVHLFEYMPSSSSTLKTTNASLHGTQLSEYSGAPSSIDSPIFEIAADHIQPELQDQSWLDDDEVYVEHRFDHIPAKNGAPANVQDRTDSGVEDGRGQFNQLQDETSQDIFRQGTHPMLDISHSQTQLHLPARYGSRFGVYHDSEGIFDPQQAVESQDYNGDTPLHRAIVAKAPDYVVIQLLLENGSDVNKPIHRSLTPFHHLCMQAPVGEMSIYLSDVFALFLDNGADVNGPIAGGRSPFQLFILAFEMTGLYTEFKDPLPVLKRLLEEGADPDNDVSSGQSLLEYFISHATPSSLRRYSYLNVLKILCERSDADRMKSREYHPLHEVLYWITKSHFTLPLKYTETLKGILQILLDRGVDVNQQSLEGYLPLALVFRSETPAIPVLDITRLLLAAGAKPLQCTPNGELIIYAALRRCGETIPGLAALLLRAIAFQEDNTLFPPCPSLSTQVAFGPSRETFMWWQRTKILLSSKLWHFAKDHITDPENVVPIDIREVIIKTALEMIGRACVDYYKSQFNKCKILGNYKEMISHGDYIIGMLTDFRSLKIFPKENWSDLLLDITSEMVAHMD